jgi:hypothetical protein
VELRGTLGDFNLPCIIQLLERSRKTGVLRIAHAEGGSALYIEQGQVVHAEHPGSEGTEAVASLLGLLQGKFWFQAEALPQRRTITISSTHLVLEAARLLDESRRDEEPEWRPWVLEEEDEWFGIKK